MKYNNYTFSDFLMDESFTRWAQNPNGKDASFWESWLADHPEKKFEAREAKKIISSLSFSDKSYSREEVSDLWQKIKLEAGEDQAASIQSSLSWGNKTFRNLFRVAAVIVPFIVAAVLFFFFRDVPQEQVVSISPQNIEKVNPKGSKLTTFLPDGSKVKLNADSKITYEKPFGENERIVTLEGEAFFDITHDKTRPFIVKSGNIITRVLGTSFNVKAYPDEGLISVAVKSGLVSVENTNLKLANDQNRSIVIQPREMATYTESSNRTEVSDFDPAEILAWNEGVLLLNNASIEEFVKVAERWYGVDIVVDRSEPITKGITGRYKDVTLESILEGHKDASEFDYEFLKDGNVLIK